MDQRKLSEPILLELVKHAVDAIVDEMAIALVRTAYSNNLKNSMDMSCALCDAQGRLIAQGMTLPLHLGSTPDAMGCIAPPPIDHDRESGGDNGRRGAFGIGSVLQD